MDDADRDSTERAELDRLCRPTSVDEFTRLRRRMRTHMAALEEQQFDHEHLDLGLATAIAEVLGQLIDSAQTLTPDQRSLLRGGLEYFLLTTDSENDVTSPVGLRDDARVVSVVARELGRADLALAEPD